jgi:manganese/iron transport system permease protein/iron/zinc/copper transport system permease protein
MPVFEPLQYEFFVRGLVAATLVGALCGAMGVFIVLRRMSYIGHGLSHAVFGGAVVSYVMSFNFYLGASLWGFLAALLINLTTRRRPQVGADAAIGVITTASFAVGVALISRYRTFTRDFDAALFGNILGVDDGDLLAIAVVTASVGAAIFLAYRQLLFTTFDPDVAPVFGVPTGWIDALFALALAATVVVSMQVLGVTMIAAAIVVPPIVARLLTDSFHRVVLTSTVVGAASGFAGVYLSWYADVSSGATVVLVGAALFIAALAFSSWRERASATAEATPAA